MGLDEDGGSYWELTAKVLVKVLLEPRLEACTEALEIHCMMRDGATQTR